MADEEEQSKLPAEMPEEVPEETVGQEGSPEDESGEPFLPAEVLEGVPEEQRRVIMRAFASVTRVADPVFNPILRRVTSGHIDKILDHVEQSSLVSH